MASHIIYYLWVLLLFVGMTAAWFSTFFALPGNWLIVGFAAIFAVFYPADGGKGIHWMTVGVAVVLAVAGEAVELLTGAVAAKRAGGSRRSVVLALVGTMIGSVVGAVVGVPVPVVGPVIGALGGGAVGAFLGAVAGETSRGRTTSESLAVGKGALIGRLLGTVGKLLLGIVMVVIITIDAII